MAVTVSISPGQLGATLRADQRRNAKAVKNGAFVAASRARDHLKSISPVFEGLFKNAWKVQRGSDGPTVTNDAPYAGVIERGARPHKVNREGVAAIREWVRKKLALLSPAGGGAPKVLTKAESGPGGAFEHYVDSITWAVIKKIEREGQKGLFLVRRSLPLFAKWLDEEINRQLSKSMGGPSGGAE